MRIWISQKRRVFSFPGKQNLEELQPAAPSSSGGTEPSENILEGAGLRSPARHIQTSPPSSGTAEGFGVRHSCSRPLGSPHLSRQVTWWTLPLPTFPSHPKIPLCHAPSSFQVNALCLWGSRRNGVLGVSRREGFT